MVHIGSCFGLNIFISNQFIQYNTIVNHTNIRIRTEAKAYQVLLLIMLSVVMVLCL